MREHKAVAGSFGGPANWRGDVLRQSKEWIRELGAEERRELIGLGARLAARANVADLARSRLDLTALPALGALVAEVRSVLKSGRGFVLVRGFPLDEMSSDAARLTYVALGTALGVPKAQNRQGELVHDVRDTGADRHDLNVRLSVTNAEQDFHTDAADIIGLLCLQKARSGGLSRIVSSVAVYNAVASARPDLAPMLFEPWYFHMKGEQPAGAPPYFQMPIAHVIGDQLATFYIGWYIRHAEHLPGVPRLTPAQHELLALFERTANDPALYLDMEFERGDMQLLKNAVILHKRTEYEDWPEPGRKRHLWRLWLAARDFTDGIAATRDGHAASAHRQAAHAA